MLDVPPIYNYILLFPCDNAEMGSRFYGGLWHSQPLSCQRGGPKSFWHSLVCSSGMDLRKKVVVGLSSSSSSKLDFPFQIEDVGGQRGQSLSSQCLLWGPLEHEEALLLLAWPPVSTRPPSSVFSTELEKALKAAWHLPFFLFFFGDSWEREQLFR